jgi:hypothetical protein
MIEQRNYCEELNKLFGPTLEEIEKDLNKWSFGKMNPDKMPGDIYFVPTIVSLGNSTIAKRTQDAFNLESPWAGNVKNLVKKQEELGDIIVIRRIYGYSGTLRALDENKDPKAILPLAKEMIECLKRDRGFNPDKLNVGIYGTFKRPGSSSPEYFRESENYAGFELRLYSQTTLAEKIE